MMTAALHIFFVFIAITSTVRHVSMTDLPQPILCQPTANPPGREAADFLLICPEAHADKKRRMKPGRNLRNNAVAEYLSR
jgi:hypothetical protein